MNIAIIIRSLSGGGAERVAQIIGDYYVEQGNKVYYFLNDPTLKQVYPVKGEIIPTDIVRHTELPFWNDAQILINLVRNSFVIRSYKRKYDIDVAISFMEESNYLNILSRRKEKVITRICTILSQDGEWVGLLHHRRLVHFFYPKADRVVVMSDYAREDMQRNFGISNRKIVKVPNPVLKPGYIDESFDWQYGSKVIVTVGRLSSEKQQERMIRAFSYVQQQKHDAKLLILGTGPRETYLKNVARKCGVEDKVIFAGFKSNVADYLRNSKLFVLTSKLEGFPNAMLEAMANGLPVVTMDSPGGCREIVGKKNDAGECREIEYCPYGILTPYIGSNVRIGSRLEQEEIMLGEAMLALLYDETLYEKYRKCSLKRASMYNLTTVMKKWDRLIGI